MKYNFFSTQIRKLRTEKHLTQEELGKKLGISRQSISSLESSRCLPSLDLAFELAKFFNQTMEKIFNQHFKPIRKEVKTMRELVPWGGFHWPEIDDFLDEEFFERPKFMLMRRLAAVPAINVEQTDKEVIVEGQIPGYKENEIEIEVSEKTITISGEKENKEEIKKKNFYRCEFASGSFSRSIALPTEVVSDKAKAEIKDGTLIVSIPKKALAKPKAVKVKIKPRG